MRFFFSLAFLLSYFFHLGAVAPERVPCVENLQIHFFVDSLVNQSLSFYDVRQELWVPINEELREKSKEIPAMMIKKTARLVPNPLEYPMQKFETAKLLKETLFDVFSSVLHKYNVDEAWRIEAAFNTLFLQRRAAFVDCFGPESQTLFKQ